MEQKSENPITKFTNKAKPDLTFVNADEPVSRPFQKSNYEILKNMVEFGGEFGKDRARKIWEKEQVWFDTAYDLLQTRDDLRYQMGGDGWEQIFALAEMLKKKAEKKYLDKILEDAMELNPDIEHKVQGGYKKADGSVGKFDLSGYKTEKAKAKSALEGKAP